MPRLFRCHCCFGCEKATRGQAVSSASPDMPYVSTGEGEAPMAAVAKATSRCHGGGESPWVPGAHCGEVATWAGTCCHLRHEEAPIWAGHLIVPVPGMTHDGLFAVGCATSALQMHYTPLA